MQPFYTITLVLWWEISQWSSRRCLPVVTWQMRRPHQQHSEKLLTYSEEDQSSNAQHSHCMDTASLDLVPPDPTLCRWEHDSYDKYSEEPNTSYHLPELLDHFQWLWDWLAPPWNLPATLPHIWGSCCSLQKDYNTSLWHSGHIQISSLKKNLCAQLQANITMTLLQDIPIFDGQTPQS